MDAGVEATQERLLDAQQAPSGVAFLFGYLSLYFGHPFEAIVAESIPHRAVTIDGLAKAVVAIVAP